MSYRTTNVKPLTSQFSRISWGAVLAGGLTALAISLLFNLLGAGIGFATIDPMEEANPLAGLGIGTIIWWIISNLLALFGGGWIAGRTAGFPNREDSGIHGFLAWGFYATVTFFLITSSVSSVVNGVGGAIGSLFNGNNNRKVMVQLDQAQQTSQQNANAGFAGIKEDVYNLINRAERYNILPNDAAEEVRQAERNIRGGATQAWNDLNVDGNVNRFFNNLSYDLDENGDLDITVEGEYFDEDNLKEYLTENTDLSRDEINGMVTKWESNIEQGIEKAEQYYATAKQKVVKYSDEAAEAMSIFCISAFLALLAGAFAAFFGGTFGAPEHTVAAVDPNSDRGERVVV